MLILESIPDTLYNTQYKLHVIKLHILVGNCTYTTRVDLLTLGHFDHNHTWSVKCIYWSEIVR